MGWEFNHRVIHISLSFKIILFSFILLSGTVFAFNFDNNSEIIIDDSFQEFSFGLVQLSSATSHVNTCSGNGTENDGSCVCFEEWSGLQCEVQSSGG